MTITKYKYIDYQCNAISRIKGRLDDEVQVYKCMYGDTWGIINVTNWELHIRYNYKVC